MTTEDKKPEPKTEKLTEELSDEQLEKVAGGMRAVVCGRCKKGVCQCD